MAQEPLTKVSTRRSWLIVLGLALGPAVSNGLGRFAYGLILPAMREELAWTYTEAGWINTANSIGYLIGALLAFRYVSTFGARRLFISGMIVTAAALIASGLTYDFWFLSLWRTLVGIGGAPVFIAGAAITSALFKDDSSRKDLAIAMYFGGGGFGMLISALSVTPLLQTMGNAAWPQTWLLLGAVSVIAIVPSSIAAAVPTTFSLRAEQLANALPLLAMAPALIGYFLFAVGYIVYVTFLVAWMKSIGATLVALTWSVVSLAVMVSPFPWRAILARSRGGAALGLSCATTGIGTLLPIVTEGSVGLVLSAVVFGLSFFIAPTAVTAFGRKNLPESQWGRSVAAFTIVFAVGQTIGPVAAGWIADQFANISTGLLAAGITLLVAALIAVQQRPISAGK